MSRDEQISTPRPKYTMENLDRILVLAGLQPLYESTGSNVLNLRSDFALPVPGATKPFVIKSAVDDITKYCDDTQNLRMVYFREVTKWFARNYINWLGSNPMIFPPSLMMPMDVYIDFILDMFSSPEDFAQFPEEVTVEDIMNELPNWARSAYVVFPHGVEFAWDTDQDDDMLYSGLFDYILHAAQHGINLERMSVPEALVNSKIWHKQNLKGGSQDGKEVLAFPDGYRIVQITTIEGLDYESAHCRHCIGKGGYDAALKGGQVTIFSLRDAKNIPIVTMEVRNKEIVQMQGLENTAPPPEVHAHLLQFMARARVHMASRSLFIRNFGTDQIVI